MLRSVLHHALDANANGTRMRNRVCARVYYMHMYVHGAALRMCLVPTPGCRLCGAYAVAVGVISMSLLWRAVHVHGPYSYGLML